MSDRGPTVLSAFGADHAASLTGLSKFRLARWDKLGFFQPEHTPADDRGNPYARVYSFSDLVSLRTLKILADREKVPLSELRKVAVQLKKRSMRPWAEIPLAVVKRKVVFDLPEEPRNVTDGQRVLKEIRIEPIARDIQKKMRQLGARDESQIGKTNRRKFVRHNQEVIAGTRIPTFAIKSLIRAGYTDRAIIKEYPLITARDIKTIRRHMDAAA